jgi:hypothetical protein
MQAMDELVHRLSQGDHPVEISLRPEKTVAAFKECLDRGYVHVKFTKTRGGTELGVRLEPNASDLKRADFEKETGTLTVVGTLTLNYEPVKCIARIDLPSLSGSGRLEPLQS